MSGNEDFLSRWTRRKREVREAEESAAGQDAPQQTALTPSENAPPPAGMDTVPPGQADLPVLNEDDVAALTAESDFTRFLKEHVPEHIKRMALRKLWTSDPLLANLDGLNDYDEDFSMLGKGTARIASSYRVGTGYSTDEEIARAARAGADEHGAPQAARGMETAEAQDLTETDETAAAEPGPDNDDDGGNGGNGGNDGDDGEDGGTLA